jgi:hypothetical protein
MMNICLLLILFLWSPAPAPCEDARMKKFAQKADFIVIAEVTEVPPPPLGELQPWSGIIASTQNVKYKVIKVLKGQVAGAQIEVMHYLQYKSYTADTVPRLSPTLFKKGNVQIIFLMVHNDPFQKGKDIWPPYVSIDEDECSVLPADPKVEGKIRRIAARR